MSSHIHVSAQHDGSVSSGDVRNDALADLDVSDSSPVSAHGNEVGYVTDEEEVHLYVEGHGGSFTQKSEEALVDALKNLDGVDAKTVSVEEGGYGGSTSSEAATESESESEE